MTEKRVLITGGAGFIGRALVSNCLKNGDQVTVVDNLCTGKAEHLAPFAGEIDFHEVDILDEARLRQVMSNARPEIVFHLAAHHYIPFCNEHPNETLRVNVEGTHVVLNEAAQQGAALAVVASTGALYPSRDTTLEEEISPEPQDIYGVSKHMAEQIARFIAGRSDMRCVTARLFNTYGPYETNPHLIPHIVESLHHAPELELGNILTKRDYIYVEDVAELLDLLARSAKNDYTVVNVGTGCEYSAEEIVRTIEELLGSTIEIRVDPSRLRPVDKLHQRADTRRLEALTGATARHTLRDGLHELILHEGLTSVGSVHDS
jgi:UDP-glucose 4-epimerase